MKSCHSQGSSRGFVAVLASALHLYVHAENQQPSISRSCRKASERGIQILVHECSALWRTQNFGIRCFRRFAQSRKAPIRFVMSVCPSACITAAPNRTVFHEIWYCGFYENLSINSKFGQNRKKILYSLQEDPSMFCCCRRQIWQRWILVQEWYNVDSDTCLSNIHRTHFFMSFSTAHHSIELFHQPTLMHNFLYSLTICLFESGLTVRSQPVYCADVYRERRYQMLCEYNFSSWRWAC